MDNKYETDDIKFIWGVPSRDSFSTKANLFTMNDIDIVYDKDKDSYWLGLETIYYFDNGNDGEVKYLETLLGKFGEFMKQNNYFIPNGMVLSQFDISELFKAKTIPELYLKFKIFVKGYKALCENYTEDKEKNDRQ